MSELAWKIIEQKGIVLASGRVRNSYIIECKCGVTRKIHIDLWKKLLAGVTGLHVGQMCRKCSLSSKSTKFTTIDVYRKLYGALVSSAKRNNRSVTINVEEASELYESNCFYCSRTPSNVFKIKNKYSEFEQPYNGIDRIDSSLGYIQGNVVACCERCNTAKNDMSLEEYYRFIDNNYSTRVHRLSETSE